METREYMKTAIDIVLEGVSNGTIAIDDAKILLSAIFL